MQFKNVGNARKVRIPNEDNPCQPEWRTVKTDGLVELPQVLGLHYGFEEVKAFESKVGPKKIETKVIEKKKNQDWKEELKSIKGIGSKTAKDILKMFPNKEALMKAIHMGELPLRDDIESALRRIYG